MVALCSQTGVKSPTRDKEPRDRGLQNRHIALSLFSGRDCKKTEPTSAKLNQACTADVLNVFLSDERDFSQVCPVDSWDTLLQ